MRSLRFDFLDFAWYPTHQTMGTQELSSVSSKEIAAAFDQICKLYTAIGTPEHEAKDEANFSTRILPLLDGHRFLISRNATDEILNVELVWEKEKGQFAFSADKQGLRTFRNGENSIYVGALRHFPGDQEIFQHIIVPMTDWLDRCVDQGEVQTFPENMLLNLRQLELLVDRIPEE
ncbi:MAG: hypothetical protein A2785_04170 [Candidatus Chisholmbacteria bacterium RIFCSPHIGHO2_01_FULL_49_18]|uniref:Uncharacterized protein n=2 Tax=Candidatus Chisholmiibacteriota TaxID=1817900 RepID=A0A1G1VPB7_9BACT|nr:MAG: hypothetical protein A2785_04170 [Candidatus Chisholmbacteria bacterium RIFCSPHIGHO2_01_FULL_49_18]